VVATRTLNTGDPNDFVIPYAANGLDVVWAHAATAIYTVTQHGVGDRANGIYLIWQSQPTAAFTTSITSLCQGSAITYSNASAGGATSFTWNFPGGIPAISSGTDEAVTVTYTAPGSYSAALTVSNTVGTSSVSQLNYITVTPTVAPSASLVLLSGTNPMCAGSPAQFTVNSSNTGSSPGFHWLVNGTTTVNGSSSFS
jgi:PKD repeat protein